MPKNKDSYFSGASRASIDLAEQIDRLSVSDTTVLIVGEAGSGKNRVARELHERSPRAAEPLVEVSLAALSPSLVESELFGHVEGAFTGAQRDRAGRFQAAARGTLVLDGIETLGELLQVKLLRALQERVVEPVGADEGVKVEARVLATATPELERRVREGSYRKDLWYRLAVVVLELPPLRARSSDLPEFAAFLVAQAAARLGVKARELSPAATALIAEHTWPGNVRELENALERVHALCGSEPGAILAEEFDFLEDERNAGAQDLARAALARGLSLEEWNQEMIRAALSEQGGNKSAAARRLGITRRALDYRLGEEQGEGT
jgi:two-component system, NtrC family, response regulator HydG